MLQRNNPLQRGPDTLPTQVSTTALLAASAGLAQKLLHASLHVSLHTGQGVKDL